ncbi:MAG TPA: VOC family protein, partial [Lacunisphaera sp.]|nr:VOC family protein [Lacunisphaera sp.]
MDRLIPMLPVKSMPESVAFYQKLGFSVERREDRWGWAMLRCDECRLMLDQSINLHRGGLRDSVVYLYPENITE